MVRSPNGIRRIRPFCHGQLQLLCPMQSRSSFLWLLVFTTSSQNVHSGRRNGALYDRKRRFTALTFTLFHRNPLVRITTAVSGRFSPVYSRFRPFTRRSVGPGLHGERIYTSEETYYNVNKINSSFKFIEVQSKH